MVFGLCWLLCLGLFLLVSVQVLSLFYCYLGICLRICFVGLHCNSVVFSLCLFVCWLFVLCVFV